MLQFAFRPILILICLLSLQACRPKNGTLTTDSSERNKEILLQTDENFSALSAQKGMKQAFLQYIDSNGVLLRPNSLPIIGSDAVDYLVKTDDSNFTLTWKPKAAAVAASGDLGYTFGIYSLRPNGKDTVLYGTYVSIWKKQADGKWKFSLDTGNDGVGEAEEF